MEVHLPPPTPSDNTPSPTHFVPLVFYRLRPVLKRPLFSPSTETSPNPFVTPRPPVTFPPTSLLCSNQTSRRAPQSLHISLRTLYTLRPTKLFTLLIDQTSSLTSDLPSNNPVSPPQRIPTPPLGNGTSSSDQLPYTVLSTSVRQTGGVSFELDPTLPRPGQPSLCLLVT